MPRVNRVQRARKPTKCGKCGQQISKGDPYRWWKFHSSGKRVRCMKPECSPRRSELTQSAIYAAVWDAQDDATETLAMVASVEDVEQVKDDLVERIDEIVEMIQEKLDNIESGMGHTEAPVWQELDERRENYESWRDEVESVDIEEWDPEAAKEEIDEDATDEEAQEQLDQLAADHISEQQQALQAAVDACPE